ncbi:Vps62-related protein, partial [Cohaesibacter celericrescens]|uniref:Vps62-related protein n=1 Tax=Cohaesibacter celericrescens TaxID=2067669 RepID=UPI00356465E4
MEFALRKAIDRTGTVLAICACSVFATHATLSPAFAENRIMGPAKGRFAQQLPTPRCDGFEDYMRDAGNFVVDGVEYLGEKTIKSTIGMGKLLAGNPSALIDEIDGTFKDLGTAAATLSKYTPLALISVIVDELPPGGFTSFLKSGVRFQDQLREGVAMGMAQNLNPLKQVRTIYSDGTEVFGDIGKVLINLDDPLAAGNEFLKLNQKWTGAGALTYMLTEKDPMTGLKKALNAMHRQIELVTNHAGPNGKVASAVFDYAMGESKKLINKIPDPKDKQVAALLAATFATTFKQTLKDPNYKRNGYNVSRHPFYFADIRELPTEWMGNDHNSGGKYDWGMDRARVEDYPGCISLGDYAYTDKHRKTIPAVCGVENGRNKWWSRPIDYKLVWGDNCSGGTHDRSVWQPVCKQGYISVGFVAGRGSWKKPKPNRIACVKNDPHLFTVVNGISAGLKFTANDKNSGAKFDITTYDRTFEGLKLTHAVPFARNKGDQRFVQSLRVAVVVPGIAPSGKNSHCAQFYAESGYRGRTTRVCATGRRNYKKSLAGGNGQMRRGFKSFHCGLGVAALKFYKGSRDQNPRIRPCDISNSNRIPLADYRGITHVEVLAHYFDPDDPKREFFSPEHQQVRLELEKACNTGTNPQACLNLAQSSTRRHDWTQAYGAIDAVRRFGLACEGNVKGACKAYRQTASSLCKAGESKACGLSQNADRLTQLTGLRADLDAKRLACNAGSPQSCADFGQSLFRIGGASVQGGTNQPPEWTEGVAVYQKLCDANFNDSCQQLKQLAGNMCISKMGKGCTITGQFRIKDAPKGYEAANRKAAIKDYEKGCNWGDEEGCQEFARTRVQDAYSDPKSSKRRLAALQGANQSTLDGTQSKTPTNNRAKDSAVQTLLESCQRGNQRSCDMHEGYLGELNSELQSDYFKCVGLGETKSCTAYGIAVEGAEKGTITKNPVSTKDGSSTYFYKEACQGVFVSGAMTKGDGEACMILGNKTLSGEDGTPANKREANSIGNFVLGCETLGHAESCLMAAKVIVGPTMPQSQKYYAVIYERKACEAGSQSACDMLLARTVDLNNAGQKPGDTRATAESCALRTTFTDFDASSQLDLEPGKLKTKFSNSGSSPLTLKFRVNQSTESEWAIIQPRESIEIEDYKNRTYVLLDANQQCVGAAKLVSGNQHFTYAAAASVVGQTAPNGNSGKAVNNTAPVKPPKSGAIKVTLDAAQNCHLHGSLASNDTGVAAMTTFENTGMEPLYVYWLDEKGQDSDYQRTGNALAIVEPGTATSIQTGIGLAYSVFSIANGQTNCVGITSIEDVNTHVTMN